MYRPQGTRPFLNKKFKDFSRTFKNTFPIFQGLHSVQKRASSLCLFQFFQNMSNFVLKVFPCLLLLVTWESGFHKVRTEFHGVSSNDWNFQELFKALNFYFKIQRLLRCVRTLCTNTVFYRGSSFTRLAFTVYNDSSKSPKTFWK